VPLLVIAPLVGNASVPVTPPVGAGLVPSDVTSVEPSGIPVVPTDPLEPIPSGEVTPNEGTAVSGSSGSSTWANAGPAHNRHQAVKSGRSAAIAENLMARSFGSPRRCGGSDHPERVLVTSVNPGPFGVSVGTSRNGRSACYAMPGSKRLRTVSRCKVAGPSQLLK